MKEFLRKKIVQNAMILLSTKGITTAIGLISSILYGVVFSKTDIALITLFEMFVEFVVSIGFGWSAVGVIRFGKEEFEKKGTLNHVSGVRMQLFLPLVIIFIIMLLIFQKNVKDYIGLTGSLTIILLILNIILLMVHDHFTQVFTTLEQHKVNAFYFVFSSVSKIIILAGFSFHFLSLSVVMYLSLNIIGLFLLFVWRMTLLKKNYIFPLYKKFERIEYVRFIKFVAPQFLGFLGLYLVNRIDVVVIKKYCTMEDLGAYNFMYGLFMKIAMGAFIINTVAFPRILYWKGKNDYTGIKTYLSKVPGIVFSGMLIISILIVLLFPSLFDWIYGNKFQVAYPSFRILLFILPFFFLSYVFVPVVNAFDRVLSLQVVNIVSAVINLIADVIFIPRFGIVGGAIGSLMCFFVNCAGIYFIVLKIKKRDVIKVER